MPLLNMFLGALAGRLCMAYLFLAKTAAAVIFGHPHFLDFNLGAKISTRSYNKKKRRA